MLFSTGTFDRVSPNEPGLALPLRLESMPDHGRTASQLLLVVPALLVLLAPALLASYVLLHEDMVLDGRREPLTMAALAVLPVLWIALAALAALVFVPRLKRQRVVTLTADAVSALERGLLGTSAWRLPTASYRGIAHHIRATAGVVSHEVILVHRDPRRSILLHTAPMVAQTTLDRYCALLRLPLVPAREVYRLPGFITAGGLRGGKRRHAFGVGQPLEA